MGVKQFSENAINEFLNYLQIEPWDYILAMDDANDSFNTFMNTFLYYFNITFPLKTLSLNKNNNKWITKGLPVVLLKHCSHLILKPLIHIFNLSLKLGIYPDQLNI